MKTSVVNSKKKLGYLDEKVKEVIKDDIPYISFSKKLKEIVNNDS